MEEFASTSKGAMRISYAWNKRAYKVCCVAMVLFICRPCKADDAIDRYIHEEMLKQHIPGLSIAVVKSGKVVKAQGYGLADVEQGTPADPQTVYWLASLSKQFTATAIMLLVQDGSIRLDDPIGRYLNPTPASWTDVTLRQLLTHTSGIKDYSNDLHAQSCSGTSEEQLVKFVGDLPLNFKPGFAVAYSNTNYIALGMVIRKVSGLGYAEFLSKRVFQPLGMSQTGRLDYANIVPHRAAGYLFENGKLRNAPILESTLVGNADAGITSTVSDLARWEAALLEGRILTHASQDAMYERGHLLDGSSVAFGYGWVIGRTAGPKFVSHSGNFPGTSTYMVRYLAQELTVIVLANRSLVGASHIARHVAALLKPEVELHLASATAEVPATTEKLRTILTGIQSDKLQPEWIAPEMWNRSDRAQGVAYLKNLFASFGVLEAVSYISLEQDGAKRRYFYEATFGDVDMIVDFTLDGEGRITSIGVDTE